MWITLILRNWALLAITLLCVALALSISHGRMLKAELDQAISSLAEYKATQQVIAEQTKTQSDKAIQEIRDEIPLLVAKAKTNALENYNRRYGGNAACGIRADGLLAGDSLRNGQAGSAEGTDASSEEFVVACAHDAGTVMLWQQWATSNGLPVK